MNPRSRMAMFVPLILGLATALQGGQGKEYNPVNILTQKLIKSPKEVGQSMADRIADYIVNGDDKGFISPESRSKDCVLAQIRSTPASWVADEVKQNKAVEVAQLYFVLGADKQARFSERMNPWTQASPDEKGVGWYSRGDARTWVKKFLGASRGDASYAASAVWISSAILNEATVRKELGEVARNLQGRAEGGAVAAAGNATGGQPMTGSAKGFDFNSLFRSGSVIGQVSYQNGRTGTMSIKMYTVHENGELVNKIGIFDITNQSNTVGQMFPISAQHSRQTFALDDRVPGMTKYTLTFVPNGNDTMISFGRPGNSRPITTSVSALYNLRAQQALTEGSIATIGDKQYYVLGQSAARGSLLFFPSDLKDRMAAGGDLSPDLVADVNRRAADGRGQNLPYTEGRSLWTAYGTAAPYHLEFDPKEGCWEVKAGSGDPDPDPAYSRKAGGDQTGGAWSDAGGTPSGSDAIKPATLQSIRNYLRAGGNEPDPIGQDFRSDLKKKDIEIWTYTKSGKPPLGYWHFWIVPAKLYAARNMPMPAPPDVPLGEKADELRLIDGHIVAITQSYATLYFDLERPLTVEMKDGRPQNLPFEQVGQVGKSSFHIADAALLKSALDLSKFPLHGKTCPDVESSLKAVMKNRLQGEDYAITGGMDSGTLAIHFGGNRLFGKFWPKSDEKLDSAAGHVDDRGPGNAFDFDSGPKDNELSDDLFVGPAEHVKTAATAKDGHSAKLYLNDAGSRMYFAFKLSLDGGKTANFSGYQLAFAKEPKDLQLPFPAVAVRDIHVRGLTAASVPSPKSRSLGDRKSGLVYAVYNDTLSSSAPGTIDPGPNCAGPLIWWGMEEKTAWADCKKDSP